MKHKKAVHAILASSLLANIALAEDGELSVGPVDVFTDAYGAIVNTAVGGRAIARQVINGVENDGGDLSLGSFNGHLSTRGAISNTAVGIASKATQIVNGVSNKK